MPLPKGGVTVVSNVTSWDTEHVARMVRDAVYGDGAEWRPEVTKVTLTGDGGKHRNFYRFTNANGDIGGLVEDTAWGNMSPTAYIGKGVVAMDSSSIRDNAVVSNHVTLSDRATVGGDARVDGTIQINLSDDAKVSQHADLRGFVGMTGHSSVAGHAHIDGVGHGLQPLLLEDSAKVDGSAHLYGVVKMSDTAHASGNADLRDNVELKGSSDVGGGAHIYKDAILWDTTAGDNCQIAEQTILLNCRMGGDAHVYNASLESIDLSGHVWVYDIKPSEAFSNAWSIIQTQKATRVSEEDPYNMGPNVRAEVKERITGDLGPSTSVEPGRAIFSSREQIEEYLESTNQRWPKLNVVAELPAARE